MGLFKGAEERATDIDESKYKDFLDKLHIKVMPQKFLLARNINSTVKEPEKGENTEEVSKNKTEFDFKKHILVNLVVVFFVIILIGGVAFLFVRNIQNNEVKRDLENTESGKIGDVQKEETGQNKEVVGDVGTVENNNDLNADTKNAVQGQDEYLDDDENSSQNKQKDNAEGVYSKDEEQADFEGVKNVVNNATTTPTSTADRVDFLNKPDDLDKDNDLLTEAEEEIYGTDPDNFDTDNDSFPDGLEVMNLFDPRFGNGARLFDSNRVQYYVSSNFGFKIMYPISWVIDEKNDLSQVIFKPEKGNDFIEVLIEDNAQDYPDILSWYNDIFSDVSSVDNIRYTEAQNIFGIESLDGFSTYFLTPDYIYTITYSPDFKKLDNTYYSTYKMFVKSFSVFENPFN